MFYAINERKDKNKKWKSIIKALPQWGIEADQHKGY